MTELMWDMANPVGTIRQFYNGFDPNDVRGTWSRIEGRFLLASSSSYARGSTGGEATHKLVNDEMPSHSHPFIAYANGGTDYSSSVKYAIQYGGPSGWWIADEEAIMATGGNKAHNNMPPYLAVDTWRRVA